MNTVTIIGNTYNIRDLIKAKGGKWDAATKSWTLSEEAWNKIASLDYGKHVKGVRVSGQDRANVTQPICQAKAYDNLYNEGGEGFNPYR